MSYEHLHTISQRPTPLKLKKYSHAILLHKVTNDQNQTKDWLDLNFNQNFNERCEKANFIDTSKNKVGKNLISNRLTIINNEIPYAWLNLEFKVFKKKVREMYYE